MLERDPHSSADRVAAILTWAVALGLVSTFGWILCDMLLHGAGELSVGYLLTAPVDAGRAGGIAPILVSTVEILGVALIAALPPGLGCAIFLAEYAHRGSVLGRLVHHGLDLLAAVPSIVFGLFGAAFFCDLLGLGFSILAGGLTLACMVLPILIRAAEEGLAAVPDAQRRASAALGLTRSATLRHVLLPQAVPGIAVGLVLSIGRALAETAALVFTSGYVARMPSSILDSGRSLSVHVFDLAMNVPGGDHRAYAAGLVLLVLLLVIDTAAIAGAEAWRMRSVAA